MEENWLVESEEEEEDPVPSAGLGYQSEYRWIDGIYISAYDCPDCLKGEDFDCDLCEFYTPVSCRLLHDPYLMQDTRTIFSICREHRAVQLKRQRKLIYTVHSELQAHGCPLHYAVLAHIVADRHPKLQVSEHRVLKIMTSHSELFERVTEGVYQCRRTKKR
jgi:hypothetical protein